MTQTDSVSDLQMDQDHRIRPTVQQLLQRSTLVFVKLAMKLSERHIMAYIPGTWVCAFDHTVAQKDSDFI